MNDDDDDASDSFDVVGCRLTCRVTAKTIRCLFIDIVFCCVGISLQEREENRLDQVCAI